MTTNIEACIAYRDHDDCAGHGRGVAAAARAELAALTPKPVERPVVEGWYWCRVGSNENRKRWEVVYVDSYGDVSESGKDGFGSWDYTFRNGTRSYTDFHGPLTPPKETP